MLQGEVFAFRPPKLRPKLLDVARAKDVDVESRSSSNRHEISAVSVIIPDDLGQNQVVPFENAEPKFLECCIESGGETLVVVVRYVGDRDDVM